MKKSKRMSVMAIGFCTLLVLGGSTLYAAKGGVKGPNKPGDDPTPPPPTELNITLGAVEGEAYSALVDVGVLNDLTTLKVGPLPRAKLSRDGGIDESSLADLNVVDLVSSKTLFNVSSGGTSGLASASHSVSTVEDLSLLRGLITAEVLSTYCSSTTDSTTASSEGGSKVVGLTIGGTSVNVSATPNSTITVHLYDGGLLDLTPKLIITVTDASGATIQTLEVAVNTLVGAVQDLLNTLVGTLAELLGADIDVLTIYINEQTAGGDGVTSASMQNSALRVHLNTELLQLLELDLLNSVKIINGDIVVSATQCGVDVITYECPECPTCPTCPPCPPEPTGFVTGGGTIGHNGATGATFASFGFNARPGKGHVNLVDHDLDIHVKADTVTDFSIEGNCATFSGATVVNDQGGYTYEATVCDNGEPGVNDTFSISTSSGYSNGGTLTGGNIQMH